MENISTTNFGELQRRSFPAFYECAQADDILGYVAFEQPLCQPLDAHPALEGIVLDWRGLAGHVGFQLGLVGMQISLSLQIRIFDKQSSQMGPFDADCFENLDV